MPSLRRNWAACVIGFCAVLGLSSCSDRSASAPAVVIGSGDGIFPAETLTDWASYAIQVSEVSILSEREIPPPDSVHERGEGYIGRTVSVSIGQTFWTSPGGGATADNQDIIVAGWVLQNGTRHLFAVAMSPRLEVGGKYVIPLVTAPGGSGNTAWGPLSTESVFERAHDPVATMDVHARGNSAVARSLSSLSDSELQRTLAETTPDPIAAKHWDLSPYERWLAVGSARP